MKSGSTETLLVGTWLAVIVFGILTPAVIGVLIGITPDYLVRSANAGQFVSATSSVGGFFTPGVTNIQTTRGSISVVGQLSAERGQPLQVTDYLKQGLQLCVQSQPLVCADLAGPWAGRMQPGPHRHYPFTPLVTAIGAQGVALWIMLGVLAVIASSAVVAAAELERHKGRPAD